MKMEEERREGQGSFDPCFDPCSEAPAVGTPEEGGAEAPAAHESEYRLLYVAGRVRLFERTRAGGRELPKQGRRLRELDEETTVIVARYVDPATGRVKTESLTKRGRKEDLSTGEKRKAWARRRNEDLAKTAREIASGRLSAPESIASAAADFLKRCGQELRPKTAETYGAGIDLFLEWLAGQKITATSALRPAVLSRFRAWLVSRPRQRVPKARRGKAKAEAERLSPFYINKDLRSVSALLHDLRRNGLVPLHDDEIADAIRPMKTPKPLPVFLEAREVRQLLEAALRHDRQRFAGTRAELAGKGEPGSTPRHGPAGPLVLAALLTGARWNELAALRWSEVDLDAGAIFLEAERVKTGAARKIPLDVTPALASLLKKMKLRAGESEYVFRGDHAMTVREGQRLIARLKKYGAPESFTWQTARRTCGCFAVCAPGVYGGASAFMAARRLGHSVLVAERYYLGTISDIPAEAKTLEDAMGAADLAASIALTVSGAEDEAEAEAAEAGR